MKETLSNRFWSMVDKLGPDDCWLWLGSKRSNGYGVLYIEEYGSRPGVHRISWELHNGVIEDNKLVLHKCDNPSCVNPNHLYLGTQSDNMVDRFKRNRCPSTSGGQFKLKSGEVWLIKKLYSSGKISQKLISRMFKVSQPTISIHVRNLTIKEVV